MSKRRTAASELSFMFRLIFSQVQNATVVLTIVVVVKKLSEFVPFLEIVRIWK